MKHFLLIWVAICSTTLAAQNTYTFPTTGDLLIEDCLGVLYDSGGPDESYTNDNLANVTLTGASGDALALTFTEFQLENFFDDLTIYDGPTTSSPVVGVYTGGSLPNNGAPIVLSGLTCTIVFDSDFSITAAGFAMSFECLDFTEPPVAAAAFPALSCTGTVAFSDASTLFPTSWAWDFGDGNTSTEENPVHTYTSPGTYDIQLTVCNENGCDTTSSEQTLTFDPDSFTCTNGFNMSYQGADTTTLCNGVLYDNGGLEGDYLEGSGDQFIIAPPGATAITLTFSSFDLGEGSGNFNRLFVLSPDGTTLAVYEGDFLPGNGQPITFEVPSIRLYFISDHFNTSSGFGVFWEADGITGPPSAAFTAETTTIPFGTAVQFTDQSTDNAGGWSWDFGDGTTSNEQNPSHVYTQSGTFSVSLTVTNCNGSDVSTPLTITVQESPALTYDPESFLVEIDAGTSTSELLNLCNLGLGDLISSISTVDEDVQVGYIFEFTTSAEGAGFTWELLNNDFEVVAQNSQTYAASTDYTEVIAGLEPGAEYYFIINNADDGGVLEEITLTDIGTGQLIFSGFFEFIPDQLYLFPPPLEGTGTSTEVTWLNIAANTNPLAAGTCEDILVTFDATALIEGTYEGSILITTNDPDNPLVTIPVTLVVNGTPALAISTNDLDFGEIQVGGNATLSFDLENTGTAALTIGGLLGDVPSFTVQSSDDLLLEPFQSQTINVVFAPDAIADFSETLTLVNNAGDDVIVNMTGAGIAAPGLTINPTDFTVELIAGQDTSLTVDIGNVGEAVLTYEVSTSSSSTGFVFNFTTDNWGGEFSWNLLNSSGEIVQSSGETSYNSNTDYSELLSGLSTAETYTLQLLDSFGDGALPTYSVTDLLSGQVVASGAFVGALSEQSVALGSPVSTFSTISPSSGTVQIDASNQLSIAIDATGLSTGIYNLGYNVNTNDPLQPTATVTVTLFVIAPVEAAIAAPSFVCGNVPVQFTDQSTNVPTSWSWDFGDGTTSTEQDPTHIYLQDGVYTISLEACNSLGCDVVEWTDYVEVELDCYAQNIPAHGNETVTVCEGTIYDSGGPTENYLEGNFGSLTIAPPGATSISITFSEFNYEEHSDFLYVYDGDPDMGVLLGAFTGTFLQGQTLTSSTGVLTIQEYTDHFLNLSGFAATFSCSSNPKPPEPEFSIVSASVCANEPVVFVDESLDFPSSWFWEFGDGGTSNEQNPFHIYSASGTYTVSLTVCNTFGCNTLLQDITININPDCLIENMPNNAQQVIFGCFGTLYDSGGADNNYVDNNSASTTIYSTAGPITLEFIEFDYEVFDLLLIIDGANLTDPVIGSFNGNELPESVTSTGNVITIVEITDFSVTKSGFQINYSCDGISQPLQGIVITNDEICDGKRSFSADSEGTLDTWYWDFGDGQTSTEASPEHEFSEHGAYEISLVACQDNVCDTMQTMIYSNKLVPEIGAPDTVALGQEIQLHGLTEAATHWSWDFGNGQTSEENAPYTTYEAAGWHDINVHLINMDVHETCDATHVHPVFVDENLTSVAEVSNVAFRVYPNPTTGIVNLRGLENLTGDYQIRIISSIGQVVKVQPLDATISIAAFPAGMYILEVVNEKEVIGRSRIIKE